MHFCLQMHFNLNTHSAPKIAKDCIWKRKSFYCKCCHGSAANKLEEHLPTRNQKCLLDDFFTVLSSAHDCMVVTVMHGMVKGNAYVKPLESSDSDRFTLEMNQCLTHIVKGPSKPQEISWCGWSWTNPGFICGKQRQKNIPESFLNYFPSRSHHLCIAHLVQLYRFTTSGFHANQGPAIIIEVTICHYHSFSHLNLPTVSSHQACAKTTRTPSAPVMAAVIAWQATLVARKLSLIARKASRSHWEPLHQKHKTANTSSTNWCIPKHKLSCSLHSLPAHNGIRRSCSERLDANLLFMLLNACQSHHLLLSWAFWGVEASHPKKVCRYLVPESTGCRSQFGPNPKRIRTCWTCLLRFGGVTKFPVGLTITPASCTCSFAMASSSSYSNDKGCAVSYPLGIFIFTDCIAQFMM